MKHITTIAFFSAFVAAQTTQATSTAPKAARDPRIPKLADFGKVPIPFGPAPKGCSKYELIIARGTNEPGPFGIITGDPLLTRVQAILPDARGYAVQYPADRTPESPEIGAFDVVNRLKLQTAACPDQKFALVGYSQGARTIRKATARPDWGAKWNDKIVAIVTFGDPGQRNPVPRPAPAFPKEFEVKTKLNCAKGDPACDGTAGSGNFDAHLTYNSKGTTWQAESAAFVVAAFEGRVLPKVDNSSR